MSIPVYTTSVITAVQKTQQNFPFPQFIMGGKGGSAGTTYQLFKKGTTYSFSLWRSGKFLIGQPFQVKRIAIPLSAAIAANMSIIPVIQFDDEASSTVGTAINPTNYPNGEQAIILTPDNFASGVIGQKNFYLELQHNGTALLGVTFPIDIEVEILDRV